jgi:membrane associated rhomboid family serine protease
MRATYLRIALWPLAMAYVAFLLIYATKSNSSPAMLLTTGFFGALIGFLLGLMFSAREHRRERQEQLDESAQRKRVKRDVLERLKRT